ncbi:hypothetical protein LTR22_012915 [Elasticomyces elasticus]|nr:hypothetical protein LTR22_012915 [Elasticomyces elasticus]KAK4926988.1 hypothetical protein LTR49_006145 [Elasticomyces elasticus]KAK5764316.1 hypothetical protein LTS12_005529 [Elasticomyces elasticus]
MDNSPAKKAAQFVDRTEEAQYSEVAPDPLGRLGICPPQVRNMIYELALPKFGGLREPGIRHFYGGSVRFPRSVAVQTTKPIAEAGHSFDDYRVRAVSKSETDKCQRDIGPALLWTSTAIFEEIFPMYAGRTMFSFDNTKKIQWWLREWTDRRPDFRSLVRYIHYTAVSTVDEFLGAVQLHIDQMDGYIAEECKIVVEFQDFSYHAQVRFNMLLAEYDPSWKSSKSAEFQWKAFEWYEDKQEARPPTVCGKAGYLGELSPTAQAINDCDTKCNSRKARITKQSFRLRVLGADEAATRCWMKCPRKIAAGAAPCNHARQGSSMFNEEDELHDHSYTIADRTTKCIHLSQR